jgi:signal transduction histidine kinase
MSHLLDDSDPRKIYLPPSLSSDPGSLAVKVALHVRQSLDLEDILQTSVQEVRQVLGADRSVICKLQNNSGCSRVVVEDVGENWLSILGLEIEESCLADQWYSFLGKGIAIATDDVNALNVPLCYLELMQSLQVQSNIVAPIIQDHDLWGILVVHQCGQTRQWTEADVRLLQQLGIQLGIAIQQAELYRQLKQQNHELEIANHHLELVLQREKGLSDLKSNFLSLTAHEFRTPMTTIRSSAELLESFDCDPEEKKLLFRQIHNAIDYMVKMLDDIRFMSRRSDEQKALNPQSIDLLSLVKDIVTNLREVLHFKHQYQCVSQDLPKITFLDERMTRQILENLLSNAMKYSSPREMIQVRFLGQDGLGVCIEVEDRGMGIPETEQSRIYETFYRAKNVAGMKGTGLGLAIVKRCVELCNGTIHVESEVNKGTCFKVYLPLLKPVC